MDVSQISLVLRVHMVWLIWNSSTVCVCIYCNVTLPRYTKFLLTSISLSIKNVCRFCAWLYFLFLHYFASTQKVGSHFIHCQVATKLTVVTEEEEKKRTANKVKRTHSFSLTRLYQTLLLFFMLFSCSIKNCVFGTRMRTMQIYAHTQHTHSHLSVLIYIYFCAHRMCSGVFQ